MKIFNKNVIENFTQRCPDEVVERVLSISTGLISKCIDELKIVTPALAGEYNFIVVDDHYFDCSTINSNLNLFVIFDAPQLQINTYKLVNDKFKQFTTRLKHAWQSSKRTKKRRLKSKKKTEQDLVLKDQNNKYTIETLKSQLIEKIVQNIDKESYVQETKYGIKLVSKKELGIEVNIYPGIKDEKKYNLYNSFTNKFFNVDFKNREINFNSKLNTVGEDFVYMIRTFNNIFYSIYNYHPNQILIESIIYNVPNSLFKSKNFYESFVKILNYLNNANLKTFSSITDNNLKMFDESLIVENPISIISEIVKYVDNNM